MTIRFYPQILAYLKKHLEFHKFLVLPPKANSTFLNFLLYLFPARLLLLVPCTCSFSSFQLSTPAFSLSFILELCIFLVQPRVSLSWSERFMERLSSVCIATTRVPTDYSRVDRYTNQGAQAYSSTRTENLKVLERGTNFM